jgi:transcriptional regulator NrdR family protein
MVCVYCSSETQVINSRLQKRLNQVWRRRTCSNCGAIFSSHEMADYSAVWRVKQINGTHTPFERDKLFLSILESCKHRPTAIADAGALADTVTSKLRQATSDGIIPVKSIISTTQVALARFDAAASVHYLAFHAPGHN